MTIRSYAFEKHLCSDVPASAQCRVSLPPALTASDRRQIHDLLRGHDAPAFHGDPTVATVLRRKLMHAETLEDAESEGVATLGTWVSYMVTGGGARTGVLRRAAQPADADHAIPLASQLGATLIGMRIRQRASMSRPDGGVLTLALLKVADCREGLVFHPTR